LEGGHAAVRVEGESAVAISVFTAEAALPLTTFCSSGLELNFDYLKDVIWEYLDLSRVYTKKKGGACVQGVVFVLPYSFLLFFASFSAAHASHVPHISLICSDA
jgi:hypothetical protein